MGENIIPLDKVRPNTKTWTSRVQVLEKSYPRTAQISRAFQRLILGDSKGTRVQATIFASDIQLFQHTFKEYRRYQISNALVRCIPPLYRLVENNYHWIINGATLVEEIEPTNDDITATFNFTPFKELHLHTNKKLAIDIIAMAIQIGAPHNISTPTGQATVQELLLITEELKPVLLTFWDQYINNVCNAISAIIESWPVIIAKRLRVTNFNGVSLSTKLSSCIIINPEIKQKESLHSWCIEHKDEIKALILAAQSSKMLGNASPTTNVVTAIEASCLETMDNFWINTTASITNFMQKFWYVGCSKCHKAIHTECGKIYKCVFCNQLSVTAEPRCRFDVQLQDTTGYITATCFSRHAEKLFSFTATELKDNTDENGVTN